MLYHRIGLTSLALVLATAPSLLAQTQTTGSITGIARDEAGKPIQGAIIRILSSQIIRTATTDASGAFRFPLLNVGDWRLEASKSGCQTVSVRLNVAPQTTSPVSLVLKTVQTAVVDVLANATTVGVDTTTTSMGKTLNSDIVQVLPIGRYSTSIAFLAPGTTGSGFSGAPAIGGGSATENSYVVDGLNTTDNRRGFQGSKLPKEFIEQTDVQTGGFAPEFSALGGVINAVTKQGSNNFTGSVSYIQNLPNAQAWDSFNPAVNQIRGDLPQQWREAVITLGGPLVKDKLFYFFGLSYTKTDADASKLSPNYQGLRDVPLAPKEINPYLKLNYYPHVDHQFSATINRRSTESGSLKAYPTSGNADLGGRTQNDTNTLNVVHDWQISSNMFLSSKYGSTRFGSYSKVNDPRPLVEDQNYYVSGPGMNNIPPGLSPMTTGFFSGGSGGWRDRDENTSRQLRMDFSWITQSHYFKIGISRKNDKYTIVDAVPDAGYNQVRLYMHRSSSYGKLGTFRGVQLRLDTNNGMAKRNEDAIYVQDLWEVTPGLKLRYGVRYEGQEVLTPKGQVFMKFSKPADVLQPRIGLTWDPKGDNSQKFSASFAEYYEAIPMIGAMRSGGTEVMMRWNYSPAQSTYNPQTGAWSVSGQPDGMKGISGGQAVVDAGGGGLPTAIVDDLKLPTRREVVLGYETQLKNGWKLGANLRWRRLVNPIEDSVPTDREGMLVDPEGFDEWLGIMFNPVAGKTYSWISQLSGQRITWKNDVFPTAYNDYKSLEVTAERKTDRWYFSGSYTWSRLFGTYEGLTSYSKGNADANINGSFDYWPYTGEGLLPLDRTHTIKGMGVYTVPAFGQEFQISGVLNIRSGMRETIYTGGDDLDIGYYNGYTILDQNYGTGKQHPWYANLDLGISFRHRLSKRVVLTPSLDIFNAFNKRTITGYGRTAWNEDYPQPDGHPFFGQPSSFQSGRSMLLTVRLEF